MWQCQVQTLYKFVVADEGGSLVYYDFIFFREKLRREVMGFVIGFLYVLEVMVCLLLAGVILLQKPKDGGLNTALSGGMGEAFFGAQMGNVLTKTTIILGTVFLMNTLLLSRLTSHSSGGSVMEGVHTSPPVQTQSPLSFTQQEAMPQE